MPVACRVRAKPASVNWTGRLPRSTRGKPTSRSSAATCWLTADCVRASASAAAENEPRVATSAKARSRRTSSISATYRGVAIVIATDAGRCDARPVGPANHQEELMPLINVKLIEDVFTPDQKHQIVERLTDAMVSIEGENMRSVTWVIVEEVTSGDWDIGGQPLRTEDVKAL